MKHWIDLVINRFGAPVAAAHTAATNIQVLVAGTFGTSVYRLDATVEQLQ